ncbi:membrane-associating domain-containing protein [Kalaharituber pfeilii]|nr:membrane-associating domain-containing protein [Kalaharituber pfeilii]
MALNPIPILRIVQGALALIVVGVDGYVHNYYIRNNRAPPSEVNFLIWNFVWTALALLYLGLAPTYFPNLHDKWVVTGVEALSVIFWFCGWIAMAAWVGNTRTCFGTVCGCARAAVVISVFEWIAWCVSLWFVVNAILSWNARNKDVEVGAVPTPYHDKPAPSSYPPHSGANIYEANPDGHDVYYAQPDSPPPAHGIRMPSSAAYGGKV